MQAKNSTETAPKRLPDLRHKPNDWAVASASQSLMGLLTPSAFQFALALAGHVEYSGKHFRVWPGQRRLKAMCRIKSSDTVRRIVGELRQHHLISVTPGKGRRTTSYLLEYVTRPAHLVDPMDYSRSVPETGTLAKSGENQVERGTRSVPVSRGLPPQRLEHTFLQLPTSKKKEGSREGGGLIRPLEAHAENIASHPLSRSFEGKSPRPLATPCGVH